MKKFLALLLALTMALALVACGGGDDAASDTTADSGDDAAASTGEAGTSAAIAKYYKENGYLIDTHTAVAANVMEQYRKATGDKTVTVFVSTASPYKFCDHVLRAIGETPAGDGVELLDQLHETTGTAIPRRLAALKGKARRFDLTCEKPGMDSVVLEFLK